MCQENRQDGLLLHDHNLGSSGHHNPLSVMSADDMDRETQPRMEV